MLEVSNINIEYNNRKILDNFSYEFLPGKIYCIVGESGVGKTTLLKIVGLLLKPDNGKVIFNGEVLPKPFTNKARKYYKEAFSYVFQEVLLLEEDTIYNNIYKITGKKISHHDLEKLNLQVTINEYVYNLSGGEKQRLAFLNLLLVEKKVLICDEITANLDDKNAVIIMNLLNELKKKGITIIMSSHDEKLIDIADEVIKLEYAPKDPIEKIKKYLKLHNLEHNSIKEIKICKKQLIEVLKTSSKVIASPEYMTHTPLSYYENLKVYDIEGIYLVETKVNTL